MTPSPAPTVLLFDVDGTLITSGGVGRRAIEQTLLERFGVDHGCSFPFGGMTDRGIVRAALANLGERVTEALIDAILASYVAILRDLVARADRATYRAHVGVTAVLDAVSGHAPVAVGLGTGNLEEGARIKLEPLALNRYFAFGGFGSDAEPRDELLAAGAERGARRLGLPRERCRVVVIGDTLRDVTAAHAIGAECLAVATGSDSAETLRGSRAEQVVADLTSPEVLRFLLP